MKRLLLIFVVALLVLSACSKKQTEPVQQTEPEEEEEVITYNYPFTGIEMAEKPTQRAIAVMINNHPKARPQTGLAAADIVFEMLAEGNITRFLAIFQSTLPEKVGPVRSAREYYFTLADGYDALYIYHGAAKFVDAMIRDRGIEHLNGAYYDNDKKLFVRESFRVAPHNSYVLFNAVNEIATAKGYTMEKEHAPFTFLEADATIAGEAADYVKIQYYHNGPIVEYKYDATTKKYLRYNDGEQTVELETNEPIAIDNLLIVEAEHRVIDDAGRRAIDIDSGGVAYLIQQGKVQYVTWENQNGRIVPVQDGEVVPFVPGKTWINFVQTNPPSNVEQVTILENNE